MEDLNKINMNAFENETNSDGGMLNPMSYIEYANNVCTSQQERHQDDSQRAYFGSPMQVHFQKNMKSPRINASQPNQ